LLKEIVPAYRASLNEIPQQLPAPVFGYFFLWVLLCSAFYGYFFVPRILTTSAPAETDKPSPPGRGTTSHPRHAARYQIGRMLGCRSGLDRLS